MTDGVRRRLLGMSGAVMLSQAFAQDEHRPAKLSPPPPPTRVPDAWLRAPVIPLWPGDPPGAAGFKPQPLPADWTAVFLRNVAKPDLHVFRPARPNGHALLVLPGGAYWFVSAANEGADLAARMTALGVTVFVLTYRLPGEGWAQRSDVPLQDAQRAMRVIRSQASRFDIDPTKVSVLGFSAGGHLAATFATEHQRLVYAEVDSIDRLNAQPFATGLVYPVVTMMKPWTHEMSRNLLLGEAASDVEVKRRSAELHVDTNMPPVFIVHAMDDEDVPVENSLRLMKAMRDAKRPVEAHLLQEGGHAFGIGYVLRELTEAYSCSPQGVGGRAPALSAYRDHEGRWRCYRLPDRFTRVLAQRRVRRRRRALR